MKFLRDPLTHFVLLGVALLLVSALVSGLFFGDTSKKIEINASEIGFLASGFQRRWQRPPTEDELRALVEGRVREEVLYREAKNMALDRDDMVVRRRMVQKMDLLSEDLALLADPTDAELEAFFRENADDYRLPPRVDLSHIYFNPDSRGASAAAAAALRLLKELRAASAPPERASDLGDRFMLRQHLKGISPDQAAANFGARFAEDLFELEPGWHGPVASGYGLHLVHVGNRVEGRLPEMQEVRDALVRDFNLERRDRARDALYEGLRERYTVSVDEEALEASILASPRSD